MYMEYMHEIDFITDIKYNSIYIIIVITETNVII